MKIVSDPDAAFAQCQLYHLPERTEPIFSSQDLGATTTLQCYISPFVIPTHLHVDYPQQDPAGPADASSGRTSFTTYHLLIGTTF